MASGIFMILDDIAVLLDDAAVMSKVAAKKTAGILGDDLAVSAEKASGFSVSRELPVLWVITKGSFFNKLIILPLAFLMSAFVPWLIVPILLVGGVYLAFEGAEKIYEYFFDKEEKAKPLATTITDEKELLEGESKKIKSAIFTDFILSVEIIMIALSAVVAETFTTQVIAVTFVAILATVGVYGLVALLIRMDDVGFYLVEKSEDLEGGKKTVYEKVGNGLITSLPKIIKILAVVGTIAMLLVGGGIFVHNIEVVHHFFDFLPSMGADLVMGVIVGVVALGAEKGLHGLLHKNKDTVN